MIEKIDFCEFCLDDVRYIVKEKEDTSYVGDKQIRYICKEAYCTKCNNHMYIAKLNDENLNSLYSRISKHNKNFN